MNDEEPSHAWQARCVGCHREHYAPSVVAVSAGGVKCVCGHVSAPMTIPEYNKALAPWLFGGPGPDQLIGQINSDSSRLVEYAKSLGVDAKPIPRDWGSRGVIVRTVDDMHVVVMRMMFTWRVAELDFDGWPTGRFWCYPADNGLRAALTNAACYGDAEPGGWVRAWDGRRG